MSQQELLRKVVQTLENAGIEYMLTGSLASSLQGEPRLTHDIDLVVAFPASAAQRITEVFQSPSFYADERQILDAVKRRSMFSVLHVDEGDKIDFWMLTDEPFDRSRFARRIVEQVFDIAIKVSSPEDTILAKLRRANLSGGSEKQFGDALSIFEVQGEKLDSAYLEHWSKELGVQSLWERLQKDSKK